MIYKELENIGIVYLPEYGIVAEMIRTYYDTIEYQGTIFSIGVEDISKYRDGYNKTIYYDIANFGEITFHNSTLMMYDEVWSTNPNSLYYDCAKFQPLRYINCKIEHQAVKEFDCGFSGYIDAYEAPYIEEFIGEYQNGDDMYMSQFSLKIINDTNYAVVNKELANCKFVIEMPRHKDNSQDILSIYTYLCMGYQILSKKTEFNWFPELVIEWDTINDLIYLINTINPSDNSNLYKALTYNDNDYEKYRQHLIEMTRGYDYNRYLTLHDKIVTQFNYFSTKKYDILNAFIKKYDYSSYLEIGVDKGDNFIKIECNNKVSVDIAQHGFTTYVMTSDDYFARLPKDKKFDVILIDGGHNHNGVYNDIINSLEHLSPNGIIMCHDMNPLNYDLGSEIYTAGDWNGDCWRGFVKVRSERDDVEMCMIEDCDWGLGFIKFGKQDKLKLRKPAFEIPYIEFEKNKKTLMNTIKLDNFMNKYVYNTEVTICAIAKNEYNYIKDWVQYHLSIGFDKIIVYDNNDIDGERYDKLLEEYIENGTVEIRDRRGQTGQQLIVYNEYYKDDNFSWVCFLDLDEYITFGENSGLTNVKDFLANYSNAGSIGLYWKCYGDNGFIYNNGQNVLERFTEPMPVDIYNPKHIRRLNCWSKTFYRKGLDIEVCEHFAVKYPADYKPIDVLGNVFSQLPSNDTIVKSYDIAYVKHFMTKTIDEWLRCKLNRGHAGVVNGGVMQEYLEKYNTTAWNYGFDNFFYYNAITEDKVKYLKAHGYTTKIEFKPKVLICVHIQNQYHYDMILKYYNIINNVCNARWIFIPNGLTYTLEESINFPYTDYYHSGDNFDLQGMIGLSSSVYEFDNDINCFINIGYPIAETDENLDEYYKCLDTLFGNEHKVRICLQNAIETNSIVISNNEKLHTNNLTNSCIGLTEVSKQFLSMSNNKISDYYIKYNTFISTYKPIYDNIITKPLRMKIETKTIQDNLVNNIMCEYQAFQIVYPAMFDNLITM